MGVSLWKYFNSLNGAILAGPAAVLDGLFHVRRMFGGALWNAWPFALLARRYADGFVGRFKTAVDVSERFIRQLPSAAGRVERIPNGSNIVRIAVNPGRASAMRDRLASEGVQLPKPVKRAEGTVLQVQVNEIWNRTTGDALAARFARAAS